MTNTMEVQVCSPGTMKPCDVCEPDGAMSTPVITGRPWVVVPTTIELLHICLWCGNTLRQKRLE